ncbi:MAG: patatin-like phospholipase family protein [Pseudomonadota bacterium]
MNAALTAAPGPADQAVATAAPRRYDFESLEGADDDLLIMLAFSGGGKRSSAFAYGALKALRKATVADMGDARSVLSAVDVISSVSGGSFPAAYYALHRDRTFGGFETDFLRKDIEAYIYGLYLLPWHWEWMVNPLWGTNDTMMRVYDRLMFHGATYADLVDKGRPLVVVGATDVGLGSLFSFTQREFELICSDLRSFPLARAVAASNGFPVLFTPITLENHRDDCPEGRPAWLPALGPERDGGETRTSYVLRAYERYLDPKQVRYVHLLDGGISDNLALRGLLNAMMIFHQSDSFMKQSVWLKTRRVLLLSVDGEAAADTSWAQQRVVTGIAQILSAVSGTQIDRYNFETMLLARQTVLDFAGRLKQLRCAVAPRIDGHACDDVQAFFDHVALSDIADEKTRKRLEAIPTGLSLSDEDVDLLVKAGEDAVERSRVFESFIDSVGRPARSSARSGS